MDDKRSAIEKKLISMTRTFLSELEAMRAIQAITLDASLDHELGIDSLGKVELLHRVEKTFYIHLTEKALTDVESLRDLAALIEQTAPSSVLTINQQYSPVLEATSLDLSSFTILIDVLKQYASREPNRPHI